MEEKYLKKLVEKNLKDSNIKLTKGQQKRYLNNLIYWTNRKDKDEDKSFKIAEKLNEQLKKELIYSAKQVENKMLIAYQKYTNDNTLTLQDMKKRLTPEELTDFRFSLDRYYKEIKETGYSDGNIVNKEYFEKMSQRAYISRLEALKTDIDLEVAKLSNVEKDKINELLLDNVNTNVEETIKEIKEVGMSVNFETSGKDFAEKMVKTNLQGDSFVNRINVNNVKLAENVKTSITRGLITGDTIDDITKEIKKNFDMSYNDVRRIVRTETNRCTNQASLEVYKNTGIIDKIQFLAARDSRTCDLCAEFDMIVFNVKDGEQGLNVPPLHPNCRCTTIPYFEPDDMDIIEAPLNSTELRDYAKINNLLAKVK